MEKEKPSSKFLRVQAGKIQPLLRYNMVDLKHSIEQGTRDLLICDYQYKEDHTHINIHLLLGYIAAISAISSAVYGYTHEFFEFETKLILSVGCGIYYLFTGILWAYNRFVKKDEIFVGKQEGKEIRVSLIFNKQSEKIKMVIVETIKGDKKTYSLDQTVGNWFTRKGEFCPEDFMKDISDCFKGQTKKLK